MVMAWHATERIESSDNATERVDLNRHDGIQTFLSTPFFESRGCVEHCLLVLFLALFALGV